MKESKKAAQQLTSQKWKHTFDPRPGTSNTSNAHFLFQRRGGQSQGRPRGKNQHRRRTDTFRTGEICETEVNPTNQSVSTNYYSKQNLPSSLPQAKGGCAIAGRISCPHLIEKWKELTSDSVILSAVTGYLIEFMVNPVQLVIPKPIKMSTQ